jgi:excisionase family DNA binding protein
MAHDTNDRILTTDAAAVYLGLKRSTLEAWRQQGGHLVFRKLGRAVRYRQTDLDKFLESQARTSTSER